MSLPHPIPNPVSQQRRRRRAAAGTRASAGGGRDRSHCTLRLGTMSDPKRRRRAATLSVGHGGGVDMISGLSDDLLVRILELLPDARDVVRTHALSRRWHGLWTGVAALRFEFCNRRIRFARAYGAAERYVAFVNDALALRATGIDSSCSIKELAISLDMFDHRIVRLAPLSSEDVQGWIRYAAQQEVKSFVLKLNLQYFEPAVMTLDGTDSYAKMETMHLGLGGIELRLPTSAALLLSLEDLSLEDLKLPAGGGYLLSRLVSSACCPCLHKLRLSNFNISEKEKLLIEAGTLLDLSIERVREVQFLELRTPSLRVLHIVNCFQLKRLTTFAPRLEDFMVLVQQSLHIDDVHGHLSNVGTLKIQLFSHGYDRNAGSIYLLQCCRLTRCLEVSFEVVVQTGYQIVDRINGWIPPLPHVISLSVCLTLWERHTSGPGIACLLAQCSNIQYLSLKLCYLISTKKKNQSELDLLCDYKCHWKSHEFSLAHLQEVEFKNLIGTNCEFRFIQSILTGAPGIRKVTITFNRRYWRKGRKNTFKLMPPLQDGSWTTCNNTSSWYNEDLVYEWTRE